MLLAVSQGWAWVVLVVLGIAVAVSGWWGWIRGGGPPQDSYGRDPVERWYRDPHRRD